MGVKCEITCDASRYCDYSRDLTIGEFKFIYTLLALGFSRLAHHRPHTPLVGHCSCQQQQTESKVPALQTHMHMPSTPS